MRTRLVILLAPVAALVLAVVVTPTTAHEPAPVAAAAVTSPALDVLRGWERRRAEAWAAGDPAALAALYVRGSPMARADVALLRRYLARGLVVRGMSRQLLAVRVVRRSDVQVTVRVTDRLVGATAVSSDGGLRLPASAPSSRRIELSRVDGRWQVVTIRRVARL